MSEKIIRDGDVIVRELGALRRMTLNRPKALNAITLDMAVTMTTFMREWAEDPAVGAVMLDGAGGRAFAAGGDIRALYDAAKSGDPLPERFWATEYHLECSDRALSANLCRDHGRRGDGRRRRAFRTCCSQDRDRTFRRSRCRRSALDFSPTSAWRSCWRGRTGHSAHIVALTGDRINAARCI